MLTESASRLKGAQQKFAESADNVAKLESNKAGKICWYYWVSHKKLPPFD